VKPSLEARRRRKRSMWFSFEDNIGRLDIAGIEARPYPTMGDLALRAQCFVDHRVIHRE